MPPRLKSLELHGYKTFAARTQFEFPGDITAIVGPNGSGKSNISDALRWVLGEQSYALLRGRKTEDMIFSGSEQRPRAGMASAMITFDNSDGWLPIDFTEVSITRRAYRDGQNEYLLNGQKVRLREISELLAQSGLAERTYTVIGQGVVDAALALKPEERRKLFEEAAGIGLYRSRREEALNRLENTKRNLERVQDILVELVPRMQSLEKQAKRAQEHERISSDLRILLRDWYGYHWNNQQIEIHRAQEILHNQEKKLSQTRDRVAEVEAEMTTLRNRMNELRGQVSALHADSARYHQDREKISRTLAILDERQRSYIGQRGSISNDIARLEEEINVNRQRLKEAKEEKLHLENEYVDAQKHVDTARKALDERQRERANAERALRNARQQLTNAETRLVQTKAHLSELENRSINEKKSLDTILTTVSTGQSDVDKASRRKDELAETKKNSEILRDQAQKAVTDYRRRVEELEGNRKQLIEKRGQKDTERSRLQAQLDVLEGAERSLSGMGEGAKVVLQASKQGRLKGTYQVFSQHLEIPKEYETAVAAALGDYLDLVLIDMNTDPEAALNLLASNEQGRAALLPKGWMKMPEKLQVVANDADCLGVASDLVVFSDGVQPVIETLLGQVVIVRDRQCARTILEALPESARAVTLRGEIFYGNGTVISGKNGHHVPAAISRPRQIRELKTTLDAVTATIDIFKNQIADSELELSKEKESGTSFERDLKLANSQVEKASEQYQQAALHFEQLKRQVDWQVKQRQTVEAQVQKTEDEKKQTSARLKSITEEIDAFRDELHQCSGTLAGLPLDEFQMQVNHWNTAAAVASRAEQEALKRQEEIEGILSKNQQQLTSIQRRLAEVNSGLESLDTERANALLNEQECNKQIETLQAVLFPAEQELKEVDKKYAEFQEIDQAAQQAQTVAERYHAQAQLDLTRQREILENLRKKIEDDFGLVAFDYSNDISGQTTLPLEGMVEQLPNIVKLPEGLEENISRMRGQLRRLGAVNPEALTEYTTVRERHEFLTSQIEDLKKADTDLRQVIEELDGLMKREFKKTFDAVSAEFKQMFTRLFGGGSARLILTDADNPTETGIDIEARLPGRRDQGLSLLSGGERSLTAVSLVFSLLKVSPTPFCVMDEVDAMLDEANVGRFRDLLRELSQTTQFIVITHNRNTVQTADVIYGITMGRDSTSKMMSLKLDEISEDYVK